jgi:hypothetical protein
MARTPMTTLAIPKIELEEKTTDLKLRLKGRIALDLADYLRAYGEANGPIDLDLLVPHMLGAFMDADRGFQTWRKGDAAKSVAM